MRIHKYWFTFIALKFLYMFLALFVYGQLTSLGDTYRYLSGRTLGSEKWWYSSTHMMDFVAGNLSQFFGNLGANIPFVILSICGIYYAVKRLELTKRELFFVLLLLSFPSFGVWTSIASKEAVGVFYLGIIAGFIVDYVKDKPLKNSLLVTFAFYLCAIFKPQYLIGIFALLLFVFLCRKFSLRGTGKTVIFLLFFLVSFLALYLARNEINELSFRMPMYFRETAASTRENTFWNNDFDVFWNAPYGMFIGFWGPTISEALSKPAQLVVFFESSMIVAFFLYFALKLIFITVRTGRINIFYMGVFVTATSWILFVNYPFGVLNPGSAIRYRENFYGFLVILFYFSYVQVNRNYTLSSYTRQNF